MFILIIHGKFLFMFSITKLSKLQYKKLLFNCLKNSSSFEFNSFILFECNFNNFSKLFNGTFIFLFEGKKVI